MLVIHNVRSANNVGSMFRSADGLKVEKIYLTGYSPYPKSNNDKRLPHVSQKVARQINKTALGAEKTVAWEYSAEIDKTLKRLRDEGFMIAALEQTKNAVDLSDYKPLKSIAVVVGNEVSGLEHEVIEQCDLCLQIPMLGKKESLNVSIAAAICLYHLRTST